MEIFWERWEITEDHIVNCPGDALLKIINKGLDKRHAEGHFLPLWKYWWDKNPDACSLVTMTQNHSGEDNQQLRFWFGEPNSFGYGGPISSSGHNLIATIYGCNEKLRGMVGKMLLGGRFEEGLIEPPLDALEHCTRPTATVIWLRNLK